MFMEKSITDLSHNLIFVEFSTNTSPPCPIKEAQYIIL
jgi:hypothetical protein